MCRSSWLRLHVLCRACTYLEEFSKASLCPSHQQALAVPFHLLVFAPSFPYGFVWNKTWCVKAVPAGQNPVWWSEHLPVRKHLRAPLHGQVCPRSIFLYSPGLQLHCFSGVFPTLKNNLLLKCWVSSSPIILTVSLLSCFHNGSFF